MASFALTVPYLRTSPLHIPRRDLVLSGADSLLLRITVVDSDSVCAKALELTGGLGGPSLQMFVWPDTYYRTSWDYGAQPYCSPPTPIWTGTGTLSDAVGAFDITLPSGTMMCWPRRCGWCVQLNYDDQGADVLMSGRLHIQRMGAAYLVSTGGLLTDDFIPVHSDTDQQVYT